MKNEILSIVENKDGSATILMNVDVDTLHALAEVGLNKILYDASTKHIQENKTENE